MFDPDMRNSIKYTLFKVLQGGKTIREIEKVHNYSGDPEERAHADEPVWHELGEVRSLVAEHLKLDKESVIGHDRKNNQFMDIVKNEIGNLRNNGTIKDWQKGKQRGVFRVVKDLPKLPGLGPSSEIRKYGRRPGRATGDDDLNEAFVRILDSRMDDTYKFALARAILDYCRDEGGMSNPNPVIKYEYLAEKFLEYYWKLHWFNIRQNPHRDESHVFQTMRTLFGDQTPKTFREAEMIHPEKIKEAKATILKKVFGHSRSRSSIVVHAFQKVHSSSYAVPDMVFYEPDDDNQQIRMHYEAIRFLNRHNATLRDSVLARWTIRLEELNPNMLKILTKLAMEKIDRGDTARFRKILGKHFDKCFYCGVCLNDDWEVDHFIPWSYVFEDRLWNMVQACTACNRKKSNSLPSEVYLDKIRKRNLELQDKITKDEFVEYDKETLPRLYGMYQACKRI